MTREETIENHRKMWNWIAENTIKRYEPIDKLQYFEENRITEIPDNYCYCCDYVQRLYSEDNSIGCCSDCPVVFAHNDCIDGEYGKWFKAVREGKIAKAAHMARLIANLPERE